MIALFIILYLLLNLAAGIYASKRVKNEQDFILAGRKLPLLIATTTVFATWFGSETVMGASASFATGGLAAVVEDPFGAALCLILVGLFFARPLYRMNLLTFGDFYKVCYGRAAETVAGIFLVLSYLGWVAAQMVAMGILFHIVLPDVSVEAGILISSAIVIAYTVTGGMWAVSITDFIQTIFIIAGLVVVAISVTGKLGGVGAVIENTPEETFRFFPEHSATGWLEHFAAWITIGLGSIPQQDVYQRVMASKSERVAVASSLLGGVMYLTIALIPLLLALCAKQLMPVPGDAQLLLPGMIMEHTAPVVNVLFFGALLSAVMSTASGALLAPASILGENLVMPLLKNKTTKMNLRVTRLSVVAIAVISLVMALARRNVYELVGEASAISLVALFVPLCAGLFFKHRNAPAALGSMLAGAGVWLACTMAETEVPALLYGLGASLSALAVISVLLPGRSAGKDALKK